MSVQLNDRPEPAEPTLLGRLVALSLGLVMLVLVVEIALRIAHPALHLSAPHPDWGAEDDHFDWNTDWLGGFIGYTYKQVPGDHDFVILINFNQTQPRTLPIWFPRAGEWHLMCDGTSASHTTPLDTWSIEMETTPLELTIAPNTALVLMSAAINE